MIYGVDLFFTKNIPIFNQDEHRKMPEEIFKQHISLKKKLMTNSSVDATSH